MSGPLLTARDVAERLNLSTETILEWIRRGELPAFRLGRAIRIREDDLDAWLQARATTADTLSKNRPRTVGAAGGMSHRRYPDD